MTNSVSNASNTVGFVDLDDMYGDEIVTTVSVQLLEDVVKAAQAIESDARYTEAQVHLVQAKEEQTNPAIALSTSASRPMAAMVASREPVGGEE
jgi:hypothetical protein